MNVELIGLSGVLYKGLAEELHLSTTSGEITILPGHEDLVSVLKPGPLHLVAHEGDEPQTYVAFGGMVTVDRDGAKVIIDELEHIDSLIESEIEAALKEAERLESSAENVHQQLQSSRLVTRHAVRLQTVRRHRPR